MHVTSWKELLSELAEFMNKADSGLNETEWGKWALKHPRYWGKDELDQTWDNHGNPLHVSVEEAKAIRGELHQVLFALCADRNNLPETVKPISTVTLMGAIISKVDEVPIKFKWLSQRVKQGGVAIKGERWALEPIPVIADLRTRLYYLLTEAMRFGSISSFKICPALECGKYFVAEDPRQHFCSPSCRDTFNNRRKSKLGKHREYYKARKARHQRALVKARRLRDEGKY